jgi:16S rRNA (adenine1518-N6/adenine1519-N6)-dimethyltransferase
LPPRPARPGFPARKSLGQHFLRDANLTRRIAAAAGDLAGVHVIEVGPGPGGLTEALLATRAVNVTAIEIDPRAVAALSRLTALHPDRLRLIEADARHVSVPGLVPPPRHIVANLPYNVATPLLVAWLGEAAAFARLTLMFQAEVAERISAAPASPAYGRLAVLAQWTCRVRIVLRLPPEAFTPRPKVSSAVVSLVPHAAQPSPALFAVMQRLTAAAFGQRRKMLRQALKSLGGRALLEAAAIAPERRAETLSIGEFDRLVRLLAAPPGSAQDGGQEAEPDQ